MPKVHTASLVRVVQYCKDALGKQMSPDVKAHC